jgi:hypothetical protein
MDYQKAEELIDKYWQGNTTLEEERALRNFLIRKKDLPEEFARVARLMHYFNENNKLNAGSMEMPGMDMPRMEVPRMDMPCMEMPGMDMPVDKKDAEKQSATGSAPAARQRYLYWRTAASLVVVALLSLLGYFMVTDREETPNLATQETQDPEKAYAYTKASLLLLSGKMNEGMTHASTLKKFKSTQNLITKQK